MALTSEFVMLFSISLIAYMLVMYAIGYIAQRRVQSVDDYILAGRRLPLSLTTITIIATWFGAESLMTTADEVADLGWRRALLDPIGISLCLVITGLFVAGPMWRMNLLTIPDFFLKRYGKLAELLASIVLVPSYFGWIAAQYVALATLLTHIYGLSVEQWIFIVAVGGTGYALMGGMWSITWTDTVQLVLIVLGLLVLGYEILWAVGHGSLVAGVVRLKTDVPAGHWRLTDADTFTRDMLAALSALAIGALGNLPVQDLMQRVFSARSARIATAACFVGAVGYMAMGLIPIGAGLAASLLLSDLPADGVVLALARQVLHPALLILFLLAIVSAVLSTIVSAVMAPAAVLAHNLIQPALVKRYGSLTIKQSLRLQRACVVAVAGASIALALSGQGAYELVQASYAMSLVGMFVPFIVGIYVTSLPPAAANLSMGVGISSWFLHVVMGWDAFLQGLIPEAYSIPHELIDTALSGLAFVLGWWWCTRRPNGPLLEAIAKGVHRMPLVPAVALVMLGIGLAQWTAPMSMAWLVLPAIALSVAALAALVARRRGAAMGLGWFALLWAGATLHTLQLSPADDALSRQASRDYQPLVCRADIVGPAVWRPNSYYRPGQEESLRWRTQWKVCCNAVRDGQQWREVYSESTLTVAGRVDHFLPGDRVTVYGSCAAVSAPTNPGQSDLRRALRDENQFVFLRADTADQITHEGTSWDRPIARIVAISVRHIDRTFRRYVPLGQAPLAAALIFGQRQQVDWDAQQQLLSTGTLHMLAISGMHIELVAGALWILCLLIGLPQRTSLITVATIVSVYALIAGANPPVLRAVFVVLAVCVARWHGRRRGLANLLAFSGLSILALRTSWMGNVGVQLSFLAVATIAVFARGVGGRNEQRDALAAVIQESWTFRERLTASLGSWTWEMARLSFWVWLMTAPLIWMNFHVVSLIAIPLNILLWPLLLVSLLSGLALALLGWFPPAASILGLVCGASLWSVGAIVQLGDWIMLGHVWLPAPPEWWMATFYALAAGGTIAIYFRPRWRGPLAWVLVGWIVIGVAPWTLGPRGHGPAWLREGISRTFAGSPTMNDTLEPLRLTFIDVGHGTSVLMELPTGEVWLYDAGHLGNSERSHQEIAGVLWDTPTARIDRLFLSHADADHYNAVPGLIQRFSIGQIIAPNHFWQHPARELGTLRQMIGDYHIPMERLVKGDQFEQGQVHSEVLHPPGDWSDSQDNGNSLTLLISYAGRTCLLPGDLEKDGLQKLLDLTPRKCDVLMAPHHGSITHDPQRIVAWCQPDWIVISGGPRSIRPHAVALYSPKESRTAITHRDGALQARIEADGHLSLWHWQETQWVPL